MQCFCHRFGLLFQNMAKIVLEKVLKELKLVKIVITSRYWRSWWQFNEAFRQSKTLLDDKWPLTGRYFKCCKVLKTNRESRIITNDHKKMSVQILIEAIVRKVETANIKVFLDGYRRAHVIACSHFIRCIIFELEFHVTLLLQWFSFWLKNCPKLLLHIQLR